MPSRSFGELRLQFPRLLLFLSLSVCLSVFLRLEFVLAWEVLLRICTAHNSGGSPRIAVFDSDVSVASSQVSAVGSEHNSELVAWSFVLRDSVFAATEDLVICR